MRSRCASSTATRCARATRRGRLTSVIGRVRGTLVEVGNGLALVECGGVGYEVHVPDSVAALLTPGAEATLLTRQTFREDAVTLYGFVEPFQRRLFDLLLGVTGCGPKAAMLMVARNGSTNGRSKTITKSCTTTYCRLHKLRHLASSSTI